MSNNAATIYSFSVIFKDHAPLAVAD